MYKIDHIVHFVDNPEEAIKDLRKNGLHVVQGGRHEQWGTYNALCYFNTAYIELIGIHDDMMRKSLEKRPAFPTHSMKPTHGEIIEMDWFV